MEGGTPHESHDVGGWTDDDDTQVSGACAKRKYLKPEVNLLPKRAKTVAGMYKCASNEVNQDKILKSAQAKGAADAARVQPPNPHEEDEEEEIICVNMVRVGIQEVEEEEVASPGWSHGGRVSFSFGTPSHPSNPVNFSFSGQQAPLSNKLCS